MASSLRVIETIEELQSLLSARQSTYDVVVLQSYEHKLRSYKPFQCWLLLSVLQSSETEEKTQVKTYLIDTLRFKDTLKASLGLLCRDVSVLKVVEAASLLQKLEEYFSCKMVNVMEISAPVETSNCYSTVLIE